ncbi:hypothetical protein VNI00_014114 [Paramarasmius palmivorus]|uniref:Uncharacterized protein n=1 Tax=Paramarasmius palmivorus TaxID=297713 RepID=A0AAW0BT55_9AGAR
MEQERGRALKEVKDAHFARMLEVKHRILQLGYSEQDDRSVQWFYLDLIHPKETLTDRRWSAIMREVTSRIQDERAYRLSTDTDGVLATRRQFVSNLYTRYKGSLIPSQWRNLPPVNFAVTLLPSLYQLLLSPDTTVVPEEPIIAAFNTLPQAIDDWIQSATSNLAEERTAPLADTFHANSSPWESATTIVKTMCCRRVTSSLSAALRHTCSATKSPGVPLAVPKLQDGEGKETARRLAALSGLDPDSATADEMDDIGAFYRCINGLRSSHAHVEPCFVGTWRPCIRYAIEQAQYDECSRRPSWNPKWSLCQDDEGVDRTDGRELWACGHCNAHVENLAKRAEVIQHVRLE